MESGACPRGHAHIVASPRPCVPLVVLDKVSEVRTCKLSFRVANGPYDLMGRRSQASTTPPGYITSQTCISGPPSALNDFLPVSGLPRAACISPYQLSLIHHVVIIRFLPVASASDHTVIAYRYRVAEEEKQSPFTSAQHRIAMYIIPHDFFYVFGFAEDRPAPVDPVVVRRGGGHCRRRAGGETVGDDGSDNAAADRVFI